MSKWLLGDGKLAVYHGEQLEAVNLGGEAELSLPPRKMAQS